MIPNMIFTATQKGAISTALPTIVNVLHGDQFVWVGSGESYQYLYSNTQPTQT